MRNLLYLLLFVGSGISAQENSLKKDYEIVLDKKNTIKFDEIVYYKMNRSFNTHRIKNGNKSAKKKLIYEIVRGTIPNNLNDTAVCEKLRKTKFSQRKIRNFPNPKN